MTGVGEAKKRNLCIPLWDVNWCSHYRKQYGGFLKIKNRAAMIQQSHYLGIIKRKQNPNSERYMCSCVHWAVFISGQDTVTT